MTLRRLAASLILIAAASPALAAAPNKPAYAGDAAHGKALFATVGCWECHGYLGQGGIGPRLGPKPMPLTAFAAYVRSPANNMPPFSREVLSAKDLVDIHAYLESVPPPVVIPPGDLPP